MKEGQNVFLARKRTTNLTAKRSIVEKRGGQKRRKESTWGKSSLTQTKGTDCPGREAPRTADGNESQIGGGGGQFKDTSITCVGKKGYLSSKRWIGRGIKTNNETEQENAVPPKRKTPLAYHSQKGIRGDVKVVS